MFPLYGKGEITVYARWESERLIQNGESPVYGYEISETPETFVMTDSLLYFVMDAGVSGTYIFNVPKAAHCSYLIMTYFIRACSTILWITICTATLSIGLI